MPPRTQPQEALASGIAVMSRSISLTTWTRESKFFALQSTPRYKAQEKVDAEMPEKAKLQSVPQFFMHDNPEFFCEMDDHAFMMTW